MARTGEHSRPRHGAICVRPVGWMAGVREPLVTHAGLVTMTDAPRPAADPAACHRTIGHARRSAEEWRALAGMLRHEEHWHEAASALVAELGFRLVEGRGGADDDGHLLVALRDRPTLRHFDPESVSYYAPVG